MEQVGFVRRIIDGQAELEVRRTAGCGSCNACSAGCEEKAHIVLMKNSLDAKVGDLVEITGDKQRLIKFTFITYMIPFIFLVTGVLIGDKVFRNAGNPNYELLSFGVGLIALAISYIVIKFIDMKIAKSDKTTISMTKIL